MCYFTLSTVPADGLALVGARPSAGTVMTMLTHWGRVTHICLGKLTIIGSDKGLSHSRHQAIIWTNTGILLIGPLGTNLSEILTKIHTFWLKKMHLKISSGKWRPFSLGLNVLMSWIYWLRLASYDELYISLAAIPTIVFTFIIFTYMISLQAACASTYYFLTCGICINIWFPYMQHVHQLMISLHAACASTYDFRTCSMCINRWFPYMQHVHQHDFLTCSMCINRWFPYMQHVHQLMISLHAACASTYDFLTCSMCINIWFPYMQHVHQHMISVHAACASTDDFLTCSMCIN